MSNFLRTQCSGGLYYELSVNGKLLANLKEQRNEICKTIHSRGSRVPTMREHLTHPGAETIGDGDAKFKAANVLFQVTAILLSVRPPDCCEFNVNLEIWAFSTHESPVQGRGEPSFVRFQDRPFEIENLAW
jgi:hypothetical protein